MIKHFKTKTEMAEEKWQKGSCFLIKKVAVKGLKQR